jgi:hypothetical protein
VEGLTVLPGFHDARLVGIALLPEKRCAVFLRRIDGVVERILLSGVERLRVDNLREGNIVLDVMARSRADVDADAVLGVLSVADLDTHRTFVDKVIARIRTGELTLFQINPSYGGAFECLCAGWHVQPVAKGELTIDAFA